MQKSEIINQIMQRHPSAGVEKGWSTYVGGMADTGSWDRYKLQLRTWEELQAFLNELLEGERIDELRRKREFIQEFENPVRSHAPGHWSTKQTDDQINRMMAESERRLLFPNSAPIENPYKNYLPEDVSQSAALLYCKIEVTGGIAKIVVAEWTDTKVKVYLKGFKTNSELDSQDIMMLGTQHLKELLKKYNNGHTNSGSRNICQIKTST